MSKEKAEALAKRAQKAAELRSQYEPLFADCYDLAMPSRPGFNETNEGADRMDRIFDETAVVATPEFAANLQSNLIPPFTRWGSLMPGTDVDERQKKEVAEALQAVTEVVFEEIANSNFDQAANEAFMDLAVGTGAIHLDEGDAANALDFTAASMPEYAILPGPRGSIGDMHFTKRVALEDLAGEVRNPIKGTIEQLKQEAGQRSEKIELVYSTVMDRDSVNEPRWTHSIHVPRFKILLREDKLVGTGSNPWIVFRWAKAPSEVWGRGPLVNVLPAVRIANLTKQLILENADMAITGMWQADDDGIINPAAIRLVPGIIIPRRPGSRIEALENPSRFDVGDIILAELRHNIRRSLFTEQLGRPNEKTPMSATEVAERMGELAKQIGPSFGRLMKEFVTPVIQRAVFILKKRGKIELPRINGREVSFVSTSPLAAAQNFQDIANMDRFIGNIAQNFGPQGVMVAVDDEEAIKWYADKYRIPFALLRKPEARKKMMDVIQQQMAAQAAPEGQAQ